MLYRPNMLYTTGVQCNRKFKHLSCEIYYVIVCPTLKNTEM